MLFASRIARPIHNSTHYVVCLTAISKASIEMWWLFSVSFRLCVCMSFHFLPTVCFQILWYAISLHICRFHFNIFQLNVMRMEFFIFQWKSLFYNYLIRLFAHWRILHYCVTLDEKEQQNIRGICAVVISAINFCIKLKKKELLKETHTHTHMLTSQ